jgi:hypothetical protein
MLSLWLVSVGVESVQVVSAQAVSAQVAWVQAAGVQVASVHVAWTHLQAPGDAGGVGYAGKTPTLAGALPRVWVRAALVKASVHGEEVANGDCISRCLEDHCEALENALEQIRITTFRASDLAGS